MDDIEFEWNQAKALLNLRKHGVSFEQATKVFTDPYARLIADPDHSDREDRFVLLGMDASSSVLVVCHCLRKPDLIRIISARNANRQERKIYKGYRYA